MIHKYIGDRAFYRRVLSVVLPIMIQSAITNFVSMLDNVMVGQVGTIPMTGVSIVNQLLFVFHMCIFGAASGAGIFTAQLFGSQDMDGVRHTFRFKILAGFFLSIAGMLIFITAGEPLINLYLQGDGDITDAQAVLGYSKEYLTIMLVGLIPFALSTAYSSTLRETGETVVPMVAGIVAVFVNLLLNYILIFGKLGAPMLGVSGAAIATVISRFAELAVVAGWTHRNTTKMPYALGLYRSFRIPGKLMKSILIKGMPLMINEFLWASSMAVINQSYSTCGLDVVPASNISATIYNLAGVGYFSMGSAVGIIMGQMMGAGQSEEAVRDTNRKLVAASCMVGLVFGLAMAAISGVFPQLYNTTQEVRTLATQFILIAAFMMTFNAYTHAAYFTLRSGGQTFVTFLFDSCFAWVICVPLAYCLTRFTDLPILPIYILCQATDFIKCIIGGFLLKKGVWIQNLTK